MMVGIFSRIGDRIVHRDMSIEDRDFRTLPETATADPQAASRILPLVCDQLRKLAQKQMAVDQVDVIAPGEVLERRQSESVHLQYFAGLGVSPVTVKSDWQFARTWLYHEFTRGTDRGTGP